ncbi:MAG: transglutaminase family protein [Gemmataceae bacterium]|nr:transglutaminase family protein [Gemmataceae bacterium]
MRKKSPATVGAALAILAGLTVVFACAAPAGEQPKAKSGEVVLQQAGLAELHAQLDKRITSAPVRVMKSGGMAGAMGATRVKVTATDPQEITLPVPQLTGGQVPLAYSFTVSPADAAREVRLRTTDGGSVVLFVRLAGKNQEVQIAWSSVVLLTSWDVTPDRAPVEPYRTATACVQSKSDEVVKLAAETWPVSGKAEEFAANIQKHIGRMKRVAQPRSLDAVGIVKSGENSICTANANLASGLMRSKGVACRSLAVIPPTSQRLEMHRIVEMAVKDCWVPFDPSCLHTDIPAKPWQHIIMARTTTQDEQVAMKPRMGMSLGCPYGQEVELLTPGVILTGQDFFWTIGKPLAEFEATEETTRLAARAWTSYLETGVLTPAQLKSGGVKTAAELSDLFKSK